MLRKTLSRDSFNSSTNLISTLLPNACATRINVPIVRLRGSFSIAEIFGARSTSDFHFHISNFQT